MSRESGPLGGGLARDGRLSRAGWLLLVGGGVLFLVAGIARSRELPVVLLGTWADATVVELRSGPAGAQTRSYVAVVEYADHTGWTYRTERLLVEGRQGGRRRPGPVRVAFRRDEPADVVLLSTDEAWPTAAAAPLGLVALAAAHRWRPRPAARR